MGTDSQRTPGERSRTRALAYDNVRDVIFLLGVEGDHFRFLEINPAFLRSTGLTEEQVVGRRVDEVIPEPSLSLVLSKYRTAIADRTTVRWEEVTPYPAGKRYGSVSVTPIIDPDGVCRSLVGTVHDVTAEARVRILGEIEQRVLEMVASGETLASTFEVLVRAIEAENPNAIASILLLSPDGKHLFHGAAPSLPEEYRRAIDGAPIGPRAGSCGTSAMLKRPVIVTDIATDALWESYRDLALPHGLRACWSTPIVSRDGRVLGTFALYYRKPRSPTQEERDLVARVVHVASIAIQRFELDEQLRALSARIDEAREAERTGIAREIHDQLGQSLTVMKMDLAWIVRRALAPEGLAPNDLVAKVKDLSALTDEIIEQVRRISAELRPGVLDDLGLAAALSWQAHELEKRTGIPCAVDVDVSDAKLSRALSTTVFRVLQEALTNVTRHADARQVEVRLAQDGRWLRLDVSDDGAGIRPEDIHAPRSLGLVGMRERARRLGGTVEVQRKPEGGTTVSLRVPVDAA